MNFEQFKQTKKLKDTPFSKLFHEARSSSTQYHNSTAIAVKLVDGEIKTHTVVKIQRGEHYHVRGTEWDGIVTLGMQPFMETTTAKTRITRQLKQIVRHKKAIKA